MTKADITIIGLEIYFITIMFIGRPYANWRHKAWINEGEEYNPVELVLFPFSWGMYGSIEYIFPMIRDKRLLYILIVSVCWPANIVLNILACATRRLFAKIDEGLIRFGVPVDERLR